MGVLLRWWFILIIVSLAVPGRSVTAQVEPWSCETIPAPSPLATPAAVPTAEAVAFPDVAGALTVFAAASLTDAFNQIANEIRAAHPEIEITFNFAGSQALVTQIAEGGAEVDVLALASPAQMKNAGESGIPVERSTANPSATWLRQQAHRSRVLPRMWFRRRTTSAPC
jgi:molybdate transport system substrate-binding protein